DDSNDWATSEIRAWLNGEFLSGFTPNEQQQIAETRLVDTNTTDKVFLLSVDEAERYFKANSDRVAQLDGEACWWWLRSAGSHGSRDAAYVHSVGGVGTDGFYVDLGFGGVRPAFWLNL
ncbi:MAG: DUF6273 domain-containing protein, partial [Coriobacteriales bacterium]|nr:DUF6273 domain-containing protein [Coriobacteriales bacterium]